MGIRKVRVERWKLKVRIMEVGTRKLKVGK